MQNHVAAANNEKAALRTGVLGTAQIAFFVISAAGPLIAMAGGIPVAMMFGNGAGLPAMFLLAILILLAFSVGYTAMARRVRNAGAFYAFAAEGLGPYAAGATGMIALLTYSAIQIAIYGLFGAAAQAVFSEIGVHLPWWAYALAAMGAIALLGYRQIDLSARILGLLVAAEYLAVIVLDFMILRSGGASGIDASAFAPDVVMQGAPAIALLLCFSAFIGFEATTIYSEEARNPVRTIPRATYLSVVLIGGFYTFSSWAMVIGVGSNQLMPLLKSTDPTMLLFSLSDHYVGAPLTLAMRLLFVTSAFASLLAFHNSIARYFFAMGREGLLPSVLGHTHPRHRSPHIGSVVQSASVVLPILLFALFDADPVLVVFTLPSGLGTLGIILLMAIASLAALCFLRKHGESMRVLILTATSFAAFVLIGALATVRFDVLAGSTSLAVLLLPLVILIFGAAGAILAGRVRAVTAEWIIVRPEQHRLAAAISPSSGHATDQETQNVLGQRGD